MNSTRSIALTGLGIAVALAVGALQPERPTAGAGSIQPIFSVSPALAQPTAPLPTAPAPTLAPAPAPAPAPQVIYIQQPPQVIYIEQLPAPVVEQLPAPAPVVEQLPAPVVEQLPAPVVEQLPAPSAGDLYQQRRLEAIKNGEAYRPRTR